MLHKLIIKHLVIIILVGIAKTLHSQSNNIKFERFIVEDGLTSINSITSDATGYMWFGGTHGLFRYDGYSFKTFTHNSADSTSLCGNNITTIYHDRDGYLYIGTENYGMCKYKPEKEKFATFNRLKKQSITSIYRDHQGLLWVGTMGKGIFVFNQDDEFVEQFKNEPQKNNSLSNNTVFDIEEDNFGRIWVATNSGAIDLFHRDTKLFNRFYYSDRQYKSVRSGQKIFIDEHGGFWIGTEGDGLYKFNYKTKSFKHFVHDEDNPNSISNNIITGMATGEFGEIWITTDGGGLNLLTSHNLRFSRFKHDPQDENSPINNSSYSLFTDKNKTIWMGMGDGVVNVSKKSPFKTYKPSNKNKNSLSFRVVVSLYLASNNKLWIGTGGGGVDEFDINTRQFKNYRHNPDNKNSISNDIILSLHEDTQGNIWVGTFLGGVNKINTVTGNIIHYKHDENNLNSLSNDHIFDIEEDYNGKIWFATMGGGLDMYDPLKKEFTHYQYNPEITGSLSSNKVRCLFEDHLNNLWIGSSDGGLQVFDRKNQSFLNWDNDQGSKSLLLNNPIHDVTEDHKGNIWIATGETGLCQINIENNELTLLTKDEGLPSNSVYGVFEDKDRNIWCCTNKGLARYNPSTGKILILNRNDGLPTNDYEAGSIIQTKDGEMFISSKKGLVSFYPDMIIQNTNEVNVTLTGFRIFNKMITPDQEAENVIPLTKTISSTNNIVLPYYLNNISFEFASIGYQNLSKIRYKYKLEGAEDRWIETDSKRRIATFSNLRPGDYIFKVYAANSAGIWSKTITQVKISITPPFWKTVWAYLLYLLAVILIVFLILKEYTKGIRLRNQLNIEKYKHEKDNEINLFKIEFFTNISHELRTPLTLIIGSLERLSNNIHQNNKTRLQLIAIHRNGQRLLHMINQLLDFRKIESGKMQLQVSKSDFISFVREVSISFNELALQKNINFNLKTEEDSIEGFFDKNKLEIIIYNLLSNAFKFTPEKGNITVKIGTSTTQNIKRITLNVIDSGIGIAASQIPHIFEMFHQEKFESSSKGTGIGLTLCKELIELHHGEIHINSDKGKGTHVSIMFPVSHAAFKQSEVFEGPIQPKEELPSVTPEEINHFEQVMKLEEGELPIMLVVEDNVDINNFISDGFKKHFKILKGYNGEEGLQLAIEYTPDIIISDITMPKMDGIELCRTVKQDFRTSHIPVILLTARTSDIYQLEGLENGADDYVTKPFNFGLLTARVGNLIEVRRLLKDRFKKEIQLEPKELAINNPDELFLDHLIKILEDHLSDPDLSIDFVAKEIGMSHSSLYRKLLALTGKGINDFIRLYRLKKAKLYFEESNYSVYEISDLTGFSSPKYFSTSFKKEFGISPSEYKKTQGRK
ncbi:response regulator [Labilibacter sediminis]|nr:response regulator [Labilibacter sediminis]